MSTNLKIAAIFTACAMLAAAEQYVPAFRWVRGFAFPFLLGVLVAPLLYRWRDDGPIRTTAKHKEIP